MRKLSLTAALLIGCAISTPTLADGHLKIVEGDPLELTIQMNHARYPVYEESWPVEKAEREWTSIHLVDVTAGANMRTDEQKVYDRYWGSLRDHMVERQRTWNLGSADVEAEWDDYMAQLEKLGLSDVLAVMQSAYERQ